MVSGVYKRKEGINAGENNPMFGKRHSEETKIKISESLIGIKHPRWKGNEVGNKGLHLWIGRHKPKVEVCEFCGEKKKLELSCIDHQYKRDIDNFRWLCRSCHENYDIKKGFRKTRWNKW